MANAIISGNGAGNGATLTNATDGGGVPSQNDNDVTVVTSNATVSGLGSNAYFDVNFFGGNDTLVADDMPWVNPDGFADSVAFDDINMGDGNDLVSLTRTGFGGGLSMGAGNDSLFLTNAGGTGVDMGADDDFLRIDQSAASSNSDEELAQKAGQPLLDLDGGSGDDTLNIMGDWTLTLASGNATLDTDGNGSGDLVTNSFTSSQFTQVIGLPALLSGTVQWDTVSTSDGNVTIASTFQNFESLNAVCFTSGTMIGTPDGDVLIEKLQPDDLVLTRNGAKPIRWVGKRRLDVIDLMANPKLLPIRVPAGSFGNGLPVKDTSFSPQHRVVARSAITERLFGTSEVLVAVKHLIGYNGIEVDGEVREVIYHHIMLDEHDVVFADGIEAETLYPGPQALEFLSDDAIRELSEIFPEFGKQPDDGQSPDGILPFLKGRDGRALAARHIKSPQPIYT